MPQDKSRRDQQPNKRRPVTIIGLAREAGVSKSTVSRVISGATSVSPEARARVLEAIRKHDYQLNAAARALRTKRSALVGLLVPGIRHIFYSTIAEVLEKDLRAQGISLLIATSGGSADGELLALNSLRSHGADAYVLSLVDEEDDRVIAALRAVSQPIVLLDRELRGVTADAVLIDPRAGLDQCLEHLASLGHRRIGLITHPLVVRPGRQVHTIFRASIERLGLEPVAEAMVPFDRVDVQAGWHAADQLVRAKATAILSLCSSPVSAGVVACLNDRGLKLPTDISLIVYDETELSAAMRPGLSALVRPLEEYAHLAGQFLTSRLADPHLPHRVEAVGTRLNVRDSTGPPPARTRRRPAVASHDAGIPARRVTRGTRPSAPIVT
jgi:LacI family transcriptional regulator